MNEHVLGDLVDDSTQSRKSVIVDALGAPLVDLSRSDIPRSHRDVDIDITTDDTPLPRAVASSDDDAIEVSDEEIETAEPPPYRAPMPSLLGLSRPPPPPSSRPRTPSSASSLPPPRSSRSSYDPWALANKTLELKHAGARIVELEELVAFRDARILELEDNLGKAQRRLEELERRLSAFESGGLGSGATRPSAPPPEDADEEFAESGERDSSDVTSGERIVIARQGSEDDLQQISGIGPRFEAALRKQGITRLSQIAAWSEADVRQVAKALKIPKSRIVKGRWVEVAREVIGTRAASE